MITGKVAKIIDNRTLVINKGSVDGVQVDMKFLVTTPGDSIKDPDSKEVLGSLKLPKLKVVVTHVNEKLSIAETFEYETINKGGQGVGMLSAMKMIQPPVYVKKYKTFDIEDSDRREIKERQSSVKSGDLVEQIEYPGAFEVL